MDLRQKDKERGMVRSVVDVNDFALRWLRGTFGGFLVRIETGLNASELVNHANDDATRIGPGCNCYTAVPRAVQREFARVAVLDEAG